MDAAGQLDGAGPPDSATEADGSAPSDAATESDAAMLDGAADSGAAMSDGGSDAGSDADAAVGTDAGSCTDIAARDYCVELPALPNEPVLDGVVECGLNLVAVPTTEWNTNQPLPSDNQARYVAAWRPNGIYFYVEVDDTLLLPATGTLSPWCGDGIELYVDDDGSVTPPDYDYPGAMQMIAASPSLDSVTIAPPARFHTRMPDMKEGDWVTDDHHIMVTRGTAGYALEALVQADDLALPAGSSLSLASGGMVGIDIAINVSVEDASQSAKCGYSLGQYYLRTSRTPCNNAQCNPSTTSAAFCMAHLE